MFQRRLSEAPVHNRDGLRSHVLLDADDFGSQHRVVTWVEVVPGAEQRPHVHPSSEQVYVIVRGTGMMSVADTQARVGEGDLVFVPPGVTHAIACDGDDPLIYASATSPPQSMAELYRHDLA